VRAKLRRARISPAETRSGAGDGARTDGVGWRASAHLGTTYVAGGPLILSKLRWRSFQLLPHPLFPIFVIDAIS
jgi:hypothetical protein